MKKIFFQLLRIFIDSTCKQGTNTNLFYPKGEIWASFSFDGMFGLTGQKSNATYNGTPAIIWGNLKERELLQLMDLFKIAARNEERVNYKKQLENAASNVWYYWHLNFEQKTPEYKIKRLQKELEEARERIAKLNNRIVELEDSLVED